MANKPEKKYNFVYLTTSIIDDKKYVGEHSTDDLECEKTKNYLGSGKYLKNALNFHGKEKFHRKILEFFPAKEEAFNAQEKYILEFNTIYPNGYNISPKGGGNVIGGISEETKELIRKKVHQKLLGNNPNKETRNKLREKAKQRTLSEKSKQKIGNSNRKNHIFSEEGLKNLIEANKRRTGIKRKTQ